MTNLIKTKNILFFKSFPQKERKQETFQSKRAKPLESYCPQFRSEEF